MSRRSKSIGSRATRLIWWRRRQQQQQQHRFLPPSKCRNRRAAQIPRAASRLRKRRCQHRFSVPFATLPPGRCPTWSLTRALTNPAPSKRSSIICAASNCHWIRSRLVWWSTSRLSTFSILWCLRRADLAISSGSGSILSAATATTTREPGGRQGEQSPALADAYKPGNDGIASRADVSQFENGIHNSFLSFIVSSTGQSSV